METVPWPVLNKSETLEDRLPKNCELELACGGRAGTCFGSRLTAFPAVKVQESPTLSPPMTGGAAELASTSLAIIGISGLLPGT